MTCAMAFAELALRASIACLLTSHIAATEIKWPLANARKLQDVSCVASFPVRNCASASSGISSDKGICVQPSAGVFECWDVCDPTHADSSAYKVVVVPPGGGEDAVEAEDHNSNIALMINQIRQGKNLDVSCAQNFADASDWCIPGHRCGGDVSPVGLNVSSSRFGTGTTAHAQSIPENRGLCVVDATGPYGRACWDMCNLDLASQKYSEGSPNAEDIVNGVRGGWDAMGASCPHFVWWPWLLGTLLVLCIVAAIATFVMKGYAHKLRKTRAFSQQPANFDTSFGVQGMRDAQLDEAERNIEFQQPPMTDPESPVERQPDFELPPMPEAQAPTQTTNWHGKIPGLDEPHLLPQADRMQSSQMQTQPSQPAMQLGPAGPSQAYGYTTTPLLTQPTALSQPPLLQATAPIAFATQPVPLSQAGSMQLPAGSVSPYYTGLRS